MSDFTDVRLPSFSDPPVVETVLSVQFREYPKLGFAEIIRFWGENLVRELPRIEQRPPYVMPIERFEREVGGTSVRFSFAQDFPSPRFWFSNDNDLVQLQPNWFAYNWRKTSDRSEYVRYPVGREKYRQWLISFARFMEDDLGGKFVPLQCEVTYINHIVLSESDLATGPLGRVFRDFLPTAGKFLPTPETAGYRASYVMKADMGPSVGRLYVAADPARSDESDLPILLLNITARGRPLGEGVDGVLAYSDFGRGWVVRAFEELTTPEMHRRWRLKEER